MYIEEFLRNEMQKDIDKAFKEIFGTIPEPTSFPTPQCNCIGIIRGFSTNTKPCPIHSLSNLITNTA